MKKKKTLYFLMLIGCLLALLLILILGSVIYIWIDKEITKKTEDVQAISTAIDNNLYTEVELNDYISEAMATATASEAERILGSLQMDLSNGKTMVEALRPLYPDNLVVVSGGRFNFIPISETLRKHEYVQENLRILENGQFEYVVDDIVISKKGIDVSKHQGKIDWDKVAADGVEFAFIRVGLRGYGTGKIVEDEYFEENIKGAIAHGLDVGVYFFSQAISEEEVREEVAFVLDKISNYELTLPIVYDVERVVDSSARMNALSVEDRTHYTKLFCQLISENGYKPMIYHNMEMATMMIQLEELEEFEKWFAYYSNDFYYPYDYGIWQYSEKGKVDGIKTDVDLNIAFRLE